MKLVSGSGSPKTGACWMSAIHWYTRGGKKTWTDQPDCVSPVIRSLAISFNDTLRDDKEREETIGPHLFAPVGTKTTEEDEAKRQAMCADRAIHVFAPFWMEKTGAPELVAHAKRLREFKTIVTREDAREALAFMDEVHKKAKAEHPKEYAYAYASASASASASAYAAAYAYASASASASASAYAAAYAYASASAYAYAVTEADRTWFKTEVIRLILDLCAVGRQAEEAVATKSRSECLEFLCSFDKAR